MTQFRKEVNKILLFKAPALIPLEKLVRTQNVFINDCFRRTITCKIINLS